MEVSRPERYGTLYKPAMDLQTAMACAESFPLSGSARHYSPTMERFPLSGSARHYTPTMERLPLSGSAKALYTHYGEGEAVATRKLSNNWLKKSYWALKFIQVLATSATLQVESLYWAGKAALCSNLSPYSPYEQYTTWNHSNNSCLLLQLKCKYIRLHKLN